MKQADDWRRRSYVTDPDMCRVCRHGINGCPAQEHLRAGRVVACIGWMAAMERV